MITLERLFGKKKKLVVGLMSGTSADGIDAVLVEIVGSGTRTHIHELAFQTYPYPKGFKKFLRQNSDASTARLDDITRLNILIGELFADATRRVVRKSGKRMDDIDLIGSHGQTVHHLPGKKRMFGKEIRSTLQIGHPSVIAKLTGIVTIGDFRVADIAVGGSGAPLVPLFDYLMLRSEKVHRAALNIGGIANVTVLPRSCSVADVVAFDTGPGNMLIDQLMMEYYHTSFDSGGTIASRGKLIPSLLHWMAAHPYLSIKPPKSTGREVFGESFVRDIRKKSKRNRTDDVITTVSEFTALSIFQSYTKFIRKRIILDELLVSGGGTHNLYLMNALERYFHGVRVRTTDALRLSPDAKEAICFALLANETVSGNPGNIPSATGATRHTALGTICLP